MTTSRLSAQARDHPRATVLVVVKHAVSQPSKDELAPPRQLQGTAVAVVAGVAVVAAAELVDRAAVAALLTEVTASHQATVVAVPSGFGKTVAVTRWAVAGRRQVTGSVSWLSLTNRVADAGSKGQGRAHVTGATPKVP